MSKSQKGMYQIKIVVIGEGGVGKTSLIKKYMDQIFTEDYRPTIGTNIFIKKMVFDGDEYNISVWDLAGQEKYEKMRFMYYKGAKGALIVGDLTRKDTFRKIQGFWAPDFYKHESQNAPIILIANKNDLEPEINDIEIEETAKNINAVSHIRTSAKIGTNVNDAFTSLIKNIVKK
jgi:small GTP-binding protein